MTGRHPRRDARPRRGLLAGLLVTGMVLVLAMTLTPDPPRLFLALAELLDPWVPGWLVARVLNVLLFVPLGLAIGSWRRPWWLLGAVAGSIAIELTQHLLDERTPDVLDVATNTLGAVLGYGTARWWRHRAVARAAAAPDPGASGR